MQQSRIHVLLVDDSPFARRALKRMLSQAPDLTIVGEAEDGKEAIDLAEDLRPDVMVLDLDMPVLDGLGVLEALRDHAWAPSVVVVSGAARSDTELTIAALERGAFDFVDKTAVSSMEIHALGGEVTEKVRAAARSRRRLLQEFRRSEAAAPSAPEVVVIGASTGGPQALFHILASLPRDFPAPIAVVQHIPPSFLLPLVERMSEKTSLPVAVGVEGETLSPGRIVFAGGRKNLEIVRRGDDLALIQRTAPSDTPHVPSVDALFSSAARACGPSALGILLTGMGRDGAEGLLEIREKGGFTLAQDEASSAVYGMPRAAEMLGAACEILPLDNIARFLADMPNRS